MQLVRLAGGRGTSWRCGDLVFKPADLTDAELAWMDTALRPRVVDATIRVSLPLRARSGRRQVAGWIALPYLRGHHPQGRWHEIAAVGRAFSQLTSSLDRPSFLDRRDDPWARADRFAWGELDIPDVPPLVAALLRLRRPVIDPPTLVHGDLTENVLLDPQEPPAVLDLSLYWRPPSFATAVVAVDAVCFHAAATDLLAQLDPAREFAQYVLRALLFRIGTDLVTGGSDLRPYTPVVRWLGR